MNSMPDKSAITLAVVPLENDWMTKTKKQIKKPGFNNEDEEAQWWASAEGRTFLKQQATLKPADKHRGSPLVSKFTKLRSIQIALRLPAPMLLRHAR